MFFSHKHRTREWMLRDQPTLGGRERSEEVDIPCGRSWHGTGAPRAASEMIPDRLGASGLGGFGGLWGVQSKSIIHS